MPARCAAAEMRYTGASYSMACPLRGCLFGAAGADILSFGRRGELFERGLCRLREVLRHGDLDGDDEIPGALRRLHAFTLHAQARARGRSLRHAHPDAAAVKGGHRDGGPVVGFGEGDGHGDREVPAVDPEHGVRIDRDGDDEVTVWASALTRFALAAQTDLLAILLAGGDAHVHAPPTHVEGHLLPLNGGAERQAGAGCEVRAGLGAESCGGAAPATEHLGEDVFESTRSPAGPGAAYVRAPGRDACACGHYRAKVLEAAGSTRPSRAGCEPRPPSRHRS